MAKKVKGNWLSKNDALVPPLIVEQDLIDRYGKQEYCESGVSKHIVREIMDDIESGKFMDDIESGKFMKDKKYWEHKEKSRFNGK